MWTLSIAACSGVPATHVCWLDPKVGGRHDAVLHLTEPGELWQWLCYYNGTRVWVSPFDSRWTNILNHSEINCIITMIFTINSSIIKQINCANSSWLQQFTPHTAHEFDYSLYWK